MQMAGILIYSEKTNHAMELISAAVFLSKEIKAVSINDPSQADELAGKGAAVYRINHPSISPADPAAVAEAIKQAVDQLEIDIVLLSSNRRGKELAGRIAQKIGAGCLTDVSSLQMNNDRAECTRNALGGATVAVQVIETDKQVIAITPKSFTIPADGAGSVQDLNVEITPMVRFIASKTKAGDNVDIEAAEVLIAIGQGVEDQADVKTVEAIAGKLGGEVACSKPVAADKKWFTEERIIGLSGKKCKPELAILLGISGQVQFAVGIRDAKTIVAINSDENAPIMNMSDYILVADLKDVLPALEKALE